MTAYANPKMMCKGKLLCVKKKKIAKQSLLCGSLVETAFKWNHSSWRSRLREFDIFYSFIANGDGSILLRQITSQSKKVPRRGFPDSEYRGIAIEAMQKYRMAS